MHIKRFAVASLLYIAFIGWYMSTFVTDATTSINLLGVVMPSLSNSIWVMLVLLVLLIGSILHMSFYAVAASLHLRKYEKDYEKVIDAISDAYLAKEDRHHVFKTPRYTMLGSLIDNSTVFPNNNINFNIEDEKISATLKIIEDIKNGKVVDLKKLSLSIDNPLVIQNDRNRYKDGSLSVKDFLSHPDKYNVGLLSEIYIDCVKTASLKEIETYKSFMTKEALSHILTRVNADENTLLISNESLIGLFDILELNKQDYLDIAASMSCCMIPEQRMKLFETLSDEHEDAIDSYLFTLFDLEMLEPANVILDISLPDEYLNFKAYRALKESNQHFNINLFV